MRSFPPQHPPLLLQQLLQRPKRRLAPFRRSKCSGSLSGTPTLGDWEDLTQRKAYHDQLSKLQAAESKSASAQRTAALPPTPSLPLGTLPGTAGRAESKKKRRASEACRDDNSPCFFSVYGLSLDDGSNNYRGLLAIDGLVVNVHKGQQFRTRKNRYTVTRISTHTLTAVDQAGRAYVWPYAGFADVAAEPDELNSIRPNFTQLPSSSRPFIVPQR